MPDYDNDRPKSNTATTTTAAATSRRIKPQSVSRRIAPDAGTTTIVERHLPNGDLYIGTFHNNLPHGSGKYLWRDGCMYQGEWKKGKATGKGKFSWPSGATFEGDFKSGRMEGTGTFIGSDGDSYRGSWLGDMKHGFGAKHYSNGDYYTGTWKRNMQDGHGRYLWRNGNEYVGDWKNGVIHGKGCFLWSNGSRYDGNWENGTPKAPGVFTWADDGSCHHSRISNGTFCPAHGKDENVKARFAHKLATPLMVDESFDDNHGVLLDDEDKIAPRICIWELEEGEARDVARHGRISDRDGLELDHVEFRTKPSVISGEVKKPGQAISKGHKNYDLMLNLQLGIRYSVGKHASSMHNLKPSDFDPKFKFWTRFPPEGSKITPPHQSVEFRWKDYCPLVFRDLRELFQVDPADYMLAICGDDALRELSSPGKSGSFFYLTQDDRFMIKTLKKSEVKALIKMLPSYYQHVRSYENSLVTKFYGVHCVKPVGGVKTRFIVMGNVFCSAYPIHRRFDLKGSSHGRITDKPKEEIDETTTLKDLDLNFVFRLQTKWFQQLMKQIDLDCEFLELEGIMDYSLLVGLHFVNKRSAKLMDTRKANERRVGMNMPARAEQDNDINEVILYLGIIDILQDYDISKKLEHAYKSLQLDPASISAVDPKMYSRRFQDFVRRIFVEEDDR